MEIGRVLGILLKIWGYSVPPGAQRYLDQQMGYQKKKHSPDTSASITLHYLRILLIWLVSFILWLNLQHP